LAKPEHSCKIHQAHNNRTKGLGLGSKPTYSPNKGPAHDMAGHN